MPYMLPAGPFSQAAGSILMAQAKSHVVDATWANPPTPDSGDTAWVLASTCLVLMMTLPGLMLFYGKQCANTRETRTHNSSSALVPGVRIPSRISV